MRRVVLRTRLQRARVVFRGVAEHEVQVDRRHVAGVWDGDGHGGHALPLQRLDRRAHAHLHVGVEAIEEIPLRHAEAEALQRRGIERRDPARPLGAHRVVLQPRALDRRAERAHVIELAAEGHHAGGGELAPLGLEPDHAARGGGNANRAARVGAHGAERHAGGDGDRGPAAGAAGRAHGIDRVAREAVARILGGRAERELVEVGLAHEDRARVAQVGRDVRVGRRGDDRGAPATPPWWACPRDRSGPSATPGCRAADRDSGPRRCPCPPAWRRRARPRR